MADYQKDLGHLFTSFQIEHAVSFAKQAAAVFPEHYYTGPDFEPHVWVVAAIAGAFNAGGIR